MYNMYIMTACIMYYIKSSLNAEHVTLVVNVLELCDDLVAGPAVLLVYKQLMILVKKKRYHGHSRPRRMLCKIEFKHNISLSFNLSIYVCLYSVSFIICPRRYTA